MCLYSPTEDFFQIAESIDLAPLALPEGLEIILLFRFPDAALLTTPAKCKISNIYWLQSDSLLELILLTNALKLN